MNNKITWITINGRKYNVSQLTPQTLAEFVVDVNKITAETDRVLRKYSIIEEVTR